MNINYISLFSLILVTSTMLPDTTAKRLDNAKEELCDCEKSLLGMVVIRTICAKEKRAFNAAKEEFKVIHSENSHKGVEAYRNYKKHSQSILRHIPVIGDSTRKEYEQQILEAYGSSAILEALYARHYGPVGDFDHYDKSIADYCEEIVDIALSDEYQPNTYITDMIGREFIRQADAAAKDEAKKSLLEKIKNTPSKQEQNN